MLDTENRPDYWIWLLAGPIPSRPSRIDEISRAVSIIRRATQILPHTVDRLCKWIGPQFEDHPTILQLRNEVLALRALARLFSDYGNRVLMALEKIGVRAILQKGCAIRLSAYHDPWVRGGEDIDIGIDAHEIARTVSTLLELGFEPAEWWPDDKKYRRANVFRRVLEETDHHELGVLVRWTLVSNLSSPEETAIRSLPVSSSPWCAVHDTEISCYISIDVHHGLTNSYSIEPMLASRRWIVREGFGGWVPTISWNLLHLTIKLYWEAHHEYHWGMHIFLDIIELLKIASVGDLYGYLDLVEFYEIQVPTYYILRRAAPLTGQAIAKPIEEYIAKWSVVSSHDLPPAKLKDMGDFWPKMWGYR